MNFLEELRWRGMLNDYTPEVEDVLQKGMITGYIGFDPTAASLGLGNYVQIMILKLFQLSGHKPIALIGGATGRIGDPSGKDQERQLKSYEELDNNVEKQVAQLKKYLDFENGDNRAIVVNNLDFYKDMNALDFLRDVGKTITVNYMLSKESVKRRLEHGISFTEFSYQLLQGYDFQCLYEKYHCLVQMGGSDQWGNITAGTEFIRRNLGEGAYAITTPLLTKADGSKFGKSEGGNIWLDPEMTSPYQFYQFWINADDRDADKYMRYFSLRPRAEIEELIVLGETNPRALKQTLAEEMTIRIHGQEAFDSVEKVTGLLFGNQGREALLRLSQSDLKIVATEIPAFEINHTDFLEGVNIADLLSEKTSILGSKSEVRKAIQNNAISVNKEKISSHETLILSDQLLYGRYLMIENGKKNKFMIVVS